MRRENIVLLINTSIMIIVGILLVIFATQVVPNKPEDYLFGQVVTLKNKETVEPIPLDDFFMIVHSKEEAFNTSNQLVGTVYTVIMRNSYGYATGETDGYLELLVGIDTHDRVSVEIVKLVQSNWTISGVQRYIKTILRNVPIDQVENIDAYDATDTDMISGMTATDTTNWIKEMVLAVIDLHLTGIPQFPMIYGASTTVSVERDATFDPLDGITAYDYQDGDLTNQINTIGFDNVDLSSPGVYNYSISVTDSDNNTTTIDVTLTVVGGEIQIFDDVFGNGYVSVQDESFVATDTVLEKYDVTHSGVAVGFIYKLNGTTEYNDWDMLSGDISIYVAISTENIILDLIFPLDEYNHSKGTYYNQVIAFANEYKNTHLSNVRSLGTDLLAGSTARSRNLVIDLLEDLKEVVLG